MTRRDREDLMAALMCGYLSLTCPSARTTFFGMGAPWRAEWLVWRAVHAVPGMRKGLYTRTSYRNAIAALEAES